MKISFINYSSGQKRVYLDRDPNRISKNREGFVSKDFSTLIDIFFIDGRIGYRESEITRTYQSRVSCAFVVGKKKRKKGFAYNNNSKA